MLTALADLSASETVTVIRGTSVLFGVIVVHVLAIWGVIAFIRKDRN